MPEYMNLRSSTNKRDTPIPPPCYNNSSSSSNSGDAKKETKPAKSTKPPAKPKLPKKVYQKPPPCDILRINDLPFELFDMIFRFASGTADVDAFFHLPSADRDQPSLTRMAALIRQRDCTMIHVCRQWRYQLLSSFYQYAVYDGEANKLLVPPPQRPLLRRLLIYIPKEYRSFRTAVRLMHLETEALRSQIIWVGLRMGFMAKLSMSEYGAMASAFPNLRSVAIEFQPLDTRSRDIFSVVIGNKQFAPPITTLVCHANTIQTQRQFVKLITKAGQCLEVLDAGMLELKLAAELFWPQAQRACTRSLASQNKDFLLAGQLLQILPRLKRLYFGVYFTEETRVGARVDPSAVCLFPELIELSCSIILNKIDTVNGNSFGNYSPQVDKMLGFIDYIFNRPLKSLKHLYMDYDQAQVLSALRKRSLPALEYMLVAKQGFKLRGGNNHPLQQPHPQQGVGIGNEVEEQPTSLTLSDSLNVAAAYSLLKHFTHWTTFTTNTHASLELTFEIHEELKMLDIRTWVITQSDANELLNKLPNLESMCVTLTKPQVYPALNTINYNICLKRLWINSVEGKYCSWDSESLDALVDLVTHMLGLGELLLFRKAIQRVKAVVSKCKSVDLYHFARTVNIGLCNYDEDIVRNTTTLCL